MLVLSRRQNEEIVIVDGGGREVVVRVLDVVGQKVRLGVIAPRDVPVHRREILDQLNAERRSFTRNYQPQRE